MLQGQKPCVQWRRISLFQERVWTEKSDPQSLKGFVLARRYCTRHKGDCKLHGKRMKNTVVITGPTSGIGLELAHLFAKDGFSLILIARYENTLAALAQQLKKDYAVRAIPIVADLSNANSIKHIMETIKRETNSIEILVNNAGFGNYGRFDLTSADIDVELINLNILSLTILTKKLLPHLIKNKGKILNVGSMAAFLPGPFMNTYFASKAYVLSFSIALREELLSLGVSVSCLCPGPTQTNFGKRAHYNHNLDRRHIMRVEDVALVAYRGLHARKAIIIPGWKNRLIAVMRVIIPKTLMAKIVRKASGY